jgi:metal-responsive CopG/Arc/MetJ family transcriptional regulator
MGTISTRVPDELEAELEAYLEDEKLDRSTAVRKLLSEGLGMSVWDFAQFAKERDITWVADDHLDADLEAL